MPEGRLLFVVEGDQLAGTSLVLQQEARRCSCTMREATADEIASGYRRLFDAPKELRAREFVRHVRRLMDYALSQEDCDERGRAELLVFSILVALDGGGALDSIDLRSDGVSIVGGLHEIWATGEDRDAQAAGS